MQVPASIRAYFLAEKFSAERRWNVGMARVFTWCAIAGFVTQAIASFAFVANPPLGWFSASCIAVMLFAIYLNDKGKVRPARLIRMATALTFFFFITRATGGLHSPCFYWGNVFVIGSMFSFGATSALPVATALVSLATYYYTQSWDHLHYFEFVTGMVFVYLLSLFFDRLSKHFINYADKQKIRAEAAFEQAEIARRNTRSILESVNEGILSILPRGIIDNVESPYFARLIDQEPYVQRSIKEVLLDKLAISADLKDQCWQTINAIVGESELNFLINDHLLVTEATYRVGLISKDLRLKWSPILDKGTVIKLTLVVEDVTEKHRKDQELRAQRAELSIIGQLLDISEEKARAFFMTAERLMQENGKRLESLSLTHEDIRILFVNAHTIKGAARTLGFVDLTPLIHEGEEEYQKILRNGNPIVRSLLQEQYQNMLVMLDRHASINFERLKRRRDIQSQHLSIERNFLEHHHSTMFQAARAAHEKSWSLDEFVDFLKVQSRQLATHIFDLLPNVIECYDETLVRVAQNLNKPKPKMVLDLPEIAVHPETRYVLDNCMVHILRNAMDHGIESPEERLRKSKPEVGQIHISAKESCEGLTLRIGDDGRGLAIDKLREKAKGLGLAPQVTIQDIAELIFVSGLSTAERVSEISGRGVGMDAVHRYVKEVGGSIGIELLGQSEPGYQSFQFVMTLPIKPKGEDLTRRRSVA